MALVASLRERLPEQAGNVGGLKRVPNRPTPHDPSLSGGKIVLMVRSGHAPERRSFPRRSLRRTRKLDPGAKAPGNGISLGVGQRQQRRVAATAVVFTDVVRSLTKRSR